MNEVNFKISINQSIEVLNELNLFKGRGVKDIGDHSDSFIKTSRSNKHVDMHKVAIANFDYEVLLIDDSIFQFSFKDGVLRYLFIQNPATFVSKDDYLATIYPTDELVQLSPEDYEDLKSGIRDWEYEQYFTEQSLSLEVNIIRYDMDSKGYLPLVHSYSHLHIGTNENLRIPCSKVLTPLKFVFFSIKNTYYNYWKTFSNQERFPERILAIKRECADLPAEYWQSIERNELFLA